MTDIQERLHGLRDTRYKAFHSGLMPTVPPDRIIGVRAPELRRLAAELSGSGQAESFLRELPHRYYEEDNLHAFIIARIKDFDECLAAVEALLPHIDNWATCDSLSPKVFKRHTRELLPRIDTWLASGHTYAVRFGIKMLMDLYLDGHFSREHPERVARVRSEEYYVRMMQAWYFATALAKQYDAALPYIEEGRLSPWVHNKTIQKAVESFRVSPERKAYLKSLRTKNRKAE